MPSLSDGAIAWFMAMQLRRYRMGRRPREPLADEWRRGVLPLRRRHGFEVESWHVDGSDQFV
jgi:hypothetical protein